MLHRESKLFVVLAVIMFLFMFSCNKYRKYNKKEIADIRERALSTSQSILGKETYFSVYQMAIDSIENWRKHELRGWRYYEKTVDYQLDSVFCVNNSGDKIFFSILGRNIAKEASGDGISHFYGVKMRNTWYFFGGPYMVLPREFYQENIYTPLSFEKLKQIATFNIYRGYLKKNSKGEWEINDDFFNDIIPSNRTLEIYNLKNEEEYVKFMVELNWSSDVNETIKKYQGDGN